MTDRNPGLEEPISLDEIISRIQSLINVVESYSDPTIKRTVFELLDWFDALHREGLSRVAGGLASIGFFDKAIDDPLVAHLFSIYGLLEIDDPRPLVDDALNEVRPYVHSHGGEIEVTGVEGGVVSVRLLGSCSGCPSSVVTLTQSFEKAVRTRWPALIRIEVQEDGDSSQWQTVSIKKKD